MKLGATIEKTKDLLQRLSASFDMRDAFVFGGLGMVGYGISLVFPPAAWITVGIALFWLGVR